MWCERKYETHSVGCTVITPKTYVQLLLFEVIWREMIHFVPYQSEFICGYFYINANLN